LHLVARGLPYVGIALTTVAWWWFGWKPAVEQTVRQDAALVQAVTARVAHVLEDPVAARFRDVRYFPRSKRGCGEVSARKRSGDYAGYTLFVAAPGGEVRFATGMPAREFIDLVAASCPDQDLIERARAVVR
jgi:hypothetical protein